MLKTILIKRKIELEEKSLADTLIEIEGIEAKRSELEKQVEESDDEEFIEKAISTEEDYATRMAALTADKKNSEAKIDGLKLELKSLIDGKEGDPKSMPHTEDKTKAYRAALNAYIRRDDPVESNVGPTELVKTDVGAVIPTDIIYQPRDQVATVPDLSQLVNRVSVTTGSGKYPVLNRTTAKFSTAAELAKNPKLAKPQFTDVTYAITTYRGSLAISHEALSDSAVDLAGIVAKDIENQKINTINELICTVLKSATAVADATSIDDVLKVKNVTLDPAYNVSIVATQSLYHYMCTLKTTSGQYLLVNDITSPAGKSLFGMPITVVKDTLLGSAGDYKCFVGDVEAFCTLFDREQSTVRWVDNDIYGELLQGAFRIDVKKVDANAGRFVTITPEVVSDVQKVLVTNESIKTTTN